MFKYIRVIKKLEGKYIGVGCMGKKQQLQYEKCREELAYQGAAVAVYKDYIKLPNGKQVEWDLIKHPGGAGILPVDRDNNVLLIEQYRNALDRMTLEIPAGKRENGEHTSVCAARELEEETGYRSSHIVHLADSVAAIGYSNEIIGLYYADELEKTKQRLDEDEWIHVKRVSLSDAIAMVLDGIIQDSKTVSAILLYDKVMTGKD